MEIILNSFGLFLGIIGALLIYIYGVPNKIDKDGVDHLVGYGGDKNEKKLAKKYIHRSNFGILLLIMSFGLQLMSNFL